MSERRSLASIGQKWSGWARIVGTAIALAALFGLGTLFYNEVWQRKELTQYRNIYYAIRRSVAGLAS